MRRGIEGPESIAPDLPAGTPTKLDFSYVMTFTKSDENLPLSHKISMPFHSTPSSCPGLPPPLNDAIHTLFGIALRKHAYLSSKVKYAYCNLITRGIGKTLKRPQSPYHHRTDPEGDPSLHMLST